MKVLFLSNSVGGLYNFRLELINRLINDSYKIYAIVPSNQEEDKLEKLGCKCVTVCMNRHGINIFEDTKLILDYKKAIKEIDPDIVLSYTVKPNIYGSLVCRLLGINTIASITGLGALESSRVIVRNIVKLLYKIAFRKIDTVIFQNKYSMEFFEKNKLGGKRHVLVAGSGVNLEKFEFCEYPNNKLPIRFLLVARIMREKGIDEFLEAAKIVCDKYDNIIFDIIGFCENNNYEVKLKAFNDSKIINYYGMQKDVRPFIEKANAVVLPSYREGMANSLLEAASMGRPILASTVPGCIETFDEGISGFGFEARSVNSLVNALIKFIKLPYEDKINMGRAGRAKMEKSFNRNTVIDEYIKEIGKILD